MINEYVLNHDYGYGKNQKEINKLELRTIEDVKAYIDELIKIDFVTKDSILNFGTKKIEIIIEKA